MNKPLLTLFTLLIFNSLFAQTNLYENPDFDKIAEGHKIIAILPFKAQVTLRPKQMKDMTPEQLQRIERAEGEGIQTAMYSWFLKRRKRGSLKIDIQDTKRTNALLLKQGIDYENINEFLPEELAITLGVDAVISGDFETNKPMSEGASAALGLLVGFWGSTNSAVINMNVHNSTDGELLWNYNKKVKGGMGSSSEDLINILMRKASRRLSYTKKGVGGEDDIDDNDEDEDDDK